MSVRRLGKGLWEVRCRTRPDPRTGRPEARRRKVRGTRYDAQAEEQRLRAEVPGSAPGITLGEWMARWLARDGIEGNTRSYYRKGWRSVQALSGTMLGALSPSDVDAALMALPKGHVRRRARKTLSAALNAAVRAGLADGSPMPRCTAQDGCEPPRRDRYTPAEVSRLLALFRGDPIEPAVVLSALCGLRREECCGLDWGDVDLARGMVSVRRALTVCDGRPVAKAPKTAGSARDLPLAGYALERMRELAPDPPEGPVLPGPCDGRAHPSALSERFRRVVEASGMRYVRFGNLRHSFATMAVEADVPLTALQSLMGHESFATTAKYVTSLHVEAKSAMEAVSDAVRHAGDTRGSAL